MKDMEKKIREVTFEDDDRLQYYSAITRRFLVKQNEVPGTFTIPCIIGLLHFGKELFDLGARISLMPLSIYMKLGLGDPNPPAMQVLMVDWIVKRPIGVFHDVQVKVKACSS